MSDQPEKPEDGDSAPDESAMPEPELLKADEVHLAEDDVSADAVEPVLNTSAEEVRLSEPSLGAAEISRDSAEAASLDEVAAEAHSVAREAEDVGTLVSGARPSEDPAEAVAPAGTAPAGGTAGDVPDAPAGTGAADTTAAPDGQAAPSADASEAAAAPAESPDDAGEDTPARLPPGIPAAPSAAPGSAAPSSAAPERAEATPEEHPVPEDAAAPDTPWAQPFAAPHPQAPGDSAPPPGGPYGLPPAGAKEPAPTRIRARSADRPPQGSNRKKLIMFGLVGLLLIALLIFAIAGIVNAMRSADPGAASSPNATPGADGIIADSISPLELEAGDCILGFDSTDVSADVTTVTCSTPHNAQLLATTGLAEDADFPGEAALSASGDGLCNSAPIDEDAAAGYTGLTLTQVTPTSRTWAEGDRRIDCFVVSDEGNVITDTLLPE